MREVRQPGSRSPDADVVTERLETAIGAGTGGAVKEEISWALRKLVEVLARERPLLLVFEDIHWAEPTLLDMIEYLADWVRDVPVRVVCLAQLELLDERPTWGGGKLNAAFGAARPALGRGVLAADRSPSGRRPARAGAPGADYNGRGGKSALSRADAREVAFSATSTDHG